MRLGADADGRLTAIGHDVVSSRPRRSSEFAEQTAVPTRMMYAGAATAAPRHRLAALDVPTPSWMRAPGETPGHVRAGVRDGRARRRGRHRPDRAARSATSPTSTPRPACRSARRDLVDCLREGAERFGWADRDPTPRRPARRPLARRHRRRRPRPTRPAARRRRRSPAPSADGTFVVAHRRRRHRHRRAHRADPDRRRRARGRRSARVTRRDRRQRPAHGDAGRRLDGHRLVGLGGRQGAARRCASELDAPRRRGARRRLRGHAPTPPTTSRPSEPFARHAFGAQFAEVRVDADTGEVARRRGCSACSPPGGSSTR